MRDLNATLDLLEEFEVASRAESEDYFDPVNPNKKEEEFRNYKSGPRYRKVKQFYLKNHQNQTLAFVLKQKEKMFQWQGGQMTILEAFEYLDTVVDDSDPDTVLSQLEHGLQTAEAIRKQYPEPEYDWFVLTGLIHDLGKVLCKPEFGLEQWAIVGDTFPVGCAFSHKCVFPELFTYNPDSKNPLHNTKYGIYQPGCGLMNVHFSFGHDEYLYQVLVHNKTTLPEEALYIIRFHSFYPWHREGQYDHLCNDRDREMLPWVQRFNPFDLYSKSSERPNWEELKDYYTALIDKYIPGKLQW